MGQDKREIPRQSNPLNNQMQTPEKFNSYGNEIMIHNVPSPTADKLSQILSCGTTFEEAKNNQKGLGQRSGSEGLNNN